MDKKEAKGESVKSNVVSHEVYIYMDNKSVKRDIKSYKFNNYACYGVLTWSQTDLHYFEKTFPVFCIPHFQIWKLEETLKHISV